MDKLIYTTIGKVILWGLVFAAAAWWYKRRTMKSQSVNQRLRVVHSHYLGNKEKLLLIEVDQQVLLLGVTANQINVLNTRQKQEPKFDSTLVPELQSVTTANVV
jgi:flagellar protein FliO/FliZ